MNPLLEVARELSTSARDLAVRINAGLFSELDEVVAAAKGALYPAKDPRMSPRMFRLSYPRLEEFRKYVDPALSSSFWRRVAEVGQ